jgi:hypothetical protein
LSIADDGGFDRDDIRSDFRLSIDVDVLSMLVVGLERDDVRSGFGLSIDVDVMSIADGGRNSIVRMFDRVLGYRSILVALMWQW